MKFLICFLSLMVASVALAEEPAELVERRSAWEKERTEAQEKIDKMYFDELEQLKKNFVQAGKLPAARAVDIAIKGGEKADNEPEALVKLSEARSKSLKKALTPIDKQYWQDLKKLRGDFQKQGSLAGIDATEAEIKKVLAAYKKTEAPKQVKEEAKEDYPLEGTWQVIVDSGGVWRKTIKENLMFDEVGTSKYKVVNRAVKIHRSDGWWWDLRIDPDNPDVMEGVDSIGQINKWVRLKK